ncbi:hypothetical protein NL676_030165 [Syzygium grande]|nr:hypothetical protein NL676_030165 [Syzygium grande]
MAIPYLFASPIAAHQPLLVRTVRLYIRLRLLASPDHRPSRHCTVPDHPHRLALPLAVAAEPRLSFPSRPFSLPAPGERYPYRLGSPTASDMAGRRKRRLASSASPPLAQPPVFAHLLPTARLSPSPCFSPLPRLPCFSLIPPPVRGESRLPLLHLAPRLPSPRHVTRTLGMARLDLGLFSVELGG